MESFADLYFCVSGAAEAAVWCCYTGKMAAKKRRIKSLLISGMAAAAALKCCFGIQNALLSAAAPLIFGGSVRIECGKNVFTLTVLLNISQQ